ncbi:Arginine metabolism regulation protein iii [Taphrina deformans PYCC 5710]|uniref:Kinase n=1 Tax=Taphrina deformans (strain PYCC 5710 / ATCC 11124 / CBS 356.35 / IMI 108563 / JCM 9778 / NBRC 8474) TaxID=1097556 RepID=R4X982_TAPDE|nr:Arginine metabolism regulation protein iii [Taphrina deformans PYCC 5710]|eukprot:CCG82276.1 Arginine metabolism regulation protein iii [Taphrina deformans PYCC 5710]
MCDEDDDEGGRPVAATEFLPTHIDSNEQSFFPVNPGEYDEKRPRFVPLSTQVAGHDGVLSDENGFVIIKPCTDTEIHFYEKCLAKGEGVMDCIPAFMGTLELNTPETLASMAPEVAAAIPEDIANLHLDPAYSPPNAVYERAVVLENLAFGYAKPCILDLKLGSRLYDDDAPMEKQLRLEAVRRSTTSGTLGVRIAGMKVWNAGENRYREYERSWGKSLTNHTIQQMGINEFFNTSIRPEQKELIASRFLEDIERILKVFEMTELRIFSPSLLFVYEGDQTSLDLAIEDEGKQMIRDELGDGVLDDAREHCSDSDGDLPSDGASSQDEELAREFCVCRMIDFAHARFAPGEGLDENILRALRAARRLVLDYLQRGYF